MSDGSGPPTGRFTRFRKLAALSAQVGADAVTRGVKRIAGVDGSLVSKSAAEKIADALGELKGAAMKLGQMAAMDGEVLPNELRVALARLQNQAPAMSFDAVAKVVQAELGKTPDEAFAEFDRTAMAAASLGQVHRARLHDGREVAVKVQYPGIAEALVSDFENLGTLIGVLSKTSKTLDGRVYYRELRDEMLLEIDYRREAELCRAFAEACRPFEQLKVPEVVEELTRERVLTLELLRGRTLREFLLENPDNDARYRVSCQLIHAIYGPLLHTGELHADPHPGNFMVLEDGRLGILDFGSVKHFSPSFVEVSRRMIRSALEQKPQDVLAICRDAGFSIEIDDAVAGPLVREVLHIAGRPLRAAEYDYAQCSVSRDLKALGAKNVASFLRIRPPAEAVLFFRAIGGCSQNLRSLGARGDFRAAYEPLRQFV
ncbi:MAG: AarF/ABC1/UbiB kinase family protein [Myxococcaceae bacterium]